MSEHILQFKPAEGLGIRVEEHRGRDPRRGRPGRERRCVRRIRAADGRRPIVDDLDPVDDLAHAPSPARQHRVARPPVGAPHGIFATRSLTRRG
jgi:hypothetical protein